ncbi:MAG: hypothetical protein MRY64_04555 [Hyphomonadaceae bacterium]|nr:hypothetical protein [Hyphomonadaceae bacterium]
MSQFPSSFRHIHLELAREAGHPAGDAEHGYDILAPLTADGHLDAAAWKTHKEKCRVRRFRPHEEDEIGTLLHGPGGRWFISYDETGEAERGYRFEDERFVPGEYVSIREDDGVVHTFRVTRVRLVD